MNTKQDLKQLAELWKQLKANPQDMALILAVDELASRLGLTLPV